MVKRVTSNWPKFMRCYYKQIFLIEFMDVALFGIAVRKWGIIVEILNIEFRLYDNVGGWR